jgi:release factor glutamine methyltransferase
VLIPRSETETVVETVISHCSDAGIDRPQLLDLGTGSGCIAISLLVQLLGASAVGTDILPDALEVAKGNAERHGVLDRFIAVKADRLALPSEVVPEGGFDVLVSNPPYVAGNEVEGLDSTVRDYEPHKALSDGQDGLTFYRSIATDAPRLLAPHGVIVVEVGDGQAQVVIDTMVSDAFLVHRETHKDRVVGQERVLVFSVH